MPYTSFTEKITAGMSWQEAINATRQQAATRYAAGDPSRLAGTPYSGYAGWLGEQLYPKPVEPERPRYIAPTPDWSPINYGGVKGGPYDISGNVTGTQEDGLTYAEAQAQASKVGGTVGFGAGGYYVIPPTEQQTELGKQDWWRRTHPRTWGQTLTPGTPTPQKEADDFLGGLGEGLGDIGTIVGFDSKSAPGYLIPIMRDSKGNVTLNQDPSTWKQDPSYQPPIDRGMSDYQQAQLEAMQRQYDLDEKQANEKLAFDISQAKTTADYNRAMLEWQKEKDARDTAMQQAQIQSQRQMQEEMIAYYNQRDAAQRATEQAQRLATLQANPASWLEYARLAGQTPAIQPWMMPLGYKDYGFQLGEAIPGWTTEGAMSGLPELQTPSAQYWARMNPSSRQQYYGYQTARTGMTPADIESKLWAQAPSGGGYGGLRRLQWEQK